MCTPDALVKRSASMRKRCEDPEYKASMSLSRRKDWSAGKYDDTFDEKHLRSKSEGAKRAWAKPGMRKKLSDALKKAWASGKFDGKFSSPSNLELSVKEAFKKERVKVVGQYRPKGCRFVFDMYLPKYNALIEVDGDYWHHSERAVSEGVPEHDAEKDRWAKDNGYTIIRLREGVLKRCGIVEMVKSTLGGLK